MSFWFLITSRAIYHSNAGVQLPYLSLLPQWGMSILCRKNCHHQPANSHTTTLEKVLLVAICFTFGFLFNFHRDEMMHTIEKFCRQFVGPSVISK